MVMMTNNTYLVHHGIQGQKWGVRRFQNPDGTLTEEGRERYLNKKVETSFKAKENAEAAAASSFIGGLSGSVAAGIALTTKYLSLPLLGATGLCTVITVGTGIAAISNKIKNVKVSKIINEDLKKNRIYETQKDIDTHLEKSKKNREEYDARLASITAKEAAMGNGSINVTLVGERENAKKEYLESEVKRERSRYRKRS